MSSSLKLSKFKPAAGITGLLIKEPNKGSCGGIKALNVKSDTGGNCGILKNEGIQKLKGIRPPVLPVKFKLLKPKNENVKLIFPLISSYIYKVFH